MDRERVRLLSPRITDTTRENVTDENKASYCCEKHLAFQEGLNYNNYTGLFSGERIHVCKRRVL